MILKVEKSRASQILVTFQPERLQAKPQLASHRHPAVSSSGQQESWWGAAVSSGRHSNTTAPTWTTHSFKQGTKATRIWPDHQLLPQTCEPFELSFFKLTVIPTKSICMIARSKSIDKSSPDFSSSHCSIHYSQRSRSEFFDSLYSVTNLLHHHKRSCWEVLLYQDGWHRAVPVPCRMTSRYTHLSGSSMSHRAHRIAASCLPEDIVLGN